jgi:hypothetical protein
MRKVLALFFALALPIAALAKTPLEGPLLGPQAFHGPGSRGFLKTCEGEFLITNIIKGSDNFSSTYWTSQGSPNAPPTVTSGATDPNGGSTAYSLIIPPAPGAGTYSLLTETLTTAVHPYPYTVSVWAQAAGSSIGGGNGTPYLIVYSGTAAVSVPIPMDGGWHLVTAQVPAGYFTSDNVGIQIGVNGNVSPGSTGTITLNLWNASFIIYPQSTLVTPADISGPLATTSAAAVATLTKPCPPGVAFRDFSKLIPHVNILKSNPLSLYEGGGLSVPYAYPPMYYQGYYWGFANTNAAPNPSLYMSFQLLKSKDGLNWSEVPTNAPYLLAYGSILANPVIAAAGSGYGNNISSGGTMKYTGTGCPSPPVLNATTNSSGGIATVTFVSGQCNFGSWPTGSNKNWSPGGTLSLGSGAALNITSTPGTGTSPNAPAQWQLHPAWLPYGCHDGTKPHPFCIVFSARATNNHATIYLAYSDTIDGVYTIRGCTRGACVNPTPLLTQTSIQGAPIGAPAGWNPIGAQYNSLASVLNIGGEDGKNYIFVSNNEEAGNATFMWSTPANPSNTSSGNALTWAGLALPPHNSTADWDYGTGYEDNQVFLNKCGFYEYIYTIYGANVVGTTKGQVAGYAVAQRMPDETPGPWFKYTAPIVPVTSPAYGRDTYIGNWSVSMIGGRFNMMMNSSNGTTGIISGSSMLDACAQSTPTFTGGPSKWPRRGHRGGHRD